MLSAYPTGCPADWSADTAGALHGGPPVARRADSHMADIQVWLFALLL